ncbi:dimethylaniline monooxygenase [Nostoc sp. NIES-3756]|uniref:flavin-containing monooxygenase n=1 Tax=Nostoc sp. NIES-3756 TaxID=1751286 RepID=UPI0007202DCB|nr:NAD(P)/FAD-dependent oxidoreductase [Nostoc sp. NIES-3756]BAT53271.1 dimethylaniline monooxygenase [Nostoc sp. NIES-3756]
MKFKNICVIGAGISGLVTAKTFIKDGYNVTIFEKKQGLGGVWEKSRTYPGLSTQSTSDTYCFSDYPMPKSYADWPSAEEMRTYLTSYAKHFGVIDKIRFQTEVIHVSQKLATNLKWVVTVKSTDTNSRQTQEENYEFDFIFVCNGIFSQPKLPSFVDQEKFTSSGGLVLHSTEFNDTSIIEDKRVVVIGVGKSACDIANLAAKTAKECTLVFRQAIWQVPRYILGLVNYKLILLTRWTEALFLYREMGKVETILHSVGKPLVWCYWRIVEKLISLQLGLDACGMKPEHHIEERECAVIASPPGFFQHIHSGKIKPIKSSITRFVPGGLELVNGETIPADVVIFGTGFRQEVPFLEEKYRQILVDEEGNFQLYRHLIHPEISQMGFVGYNSSLYTPLTSEVGAWWLLDYVNGIMPLPSTLEMYQEISTELDWMKSHFSKVVVGGTCITSFCLRYIEQLLKDMDTNHQLVIWKRIPQLFSVLDISMYQKLRQELNSYR